MPNSDDLLVFVDDTERALREHLAEALAPEGCSVSEWLVLRELHRAEGLTMSELADRLRLRAPTTTKIIDRLEANNMAYRRLDPADRRRVRLHLSPRGRTVHATLAAVVARADAQRFGEDDLGQLARASAVVLAALDRRGRPVVGDTADTGAWHD